MSPRLPPLELDDIDPSLNVITGRVVDASIHVHRHLGPGVLEKVYEEALAHVLRSRGLAVERQVAFPVSFEGLVLDGGYRVDHLVEDKVVVELKAVEHLSAVHFAQVLTYLKLSGRHVGLLLNFNAVPLVSGVHRIVRSA